MPVLVRLAHRFLFLFSDIFYIANDPPILAAAQRNLFARCGTWISSHCKAGVCAGETKIQKLDFKEPVYKI